jgi:hypothetical protein
MPPVSVLPTPAGGGRFYFREANMKSRTSVKAVEEPVVSHDDPEYDGFLARIQARFLENTDNGAAPVFTTDAADLWPLYLGSIPAVHRQHYTCHSCQHFIEKFGGLVTISHEGKTASAIWTAEDAPSLYAPAMLALQRAVNRAKVTGVFKSSEKTWGLPVTGDWHHLAIIPPASMIYRQGILTAFQAAAEKHEEYITVSKALSEIPKANLETALRLLRSDALYRSEKVLGQAEWLYALQTARATTRNTAIKNNLTWLAVALAPAGFCHPRASMIGSLLEDIEAGMDFDSVSRRFASKMHPLQYQRPQEAPTAGAIAAAEKLVEKLGIAASLQRRYARLEEIEAFWRPRAIPDAPASAGIFGHLKAKGEQHPADMVIPPQTMTWEKFERTVLPTADKIEYKTKSRYEHEPFCSLVTACDFDAPPILQWDNLENRNPFSWYFWQGGSTAEGYSLAPDSWHAVNAITRKPSEWHGGNDHQGSAILFVIEGARDTRPCNMCLFPEILKADLHGVRSVIEAYSHSTQLIGVEESSAAGIAAEKGHDWNIRIRVTAGGIKTEYKLDRWD